MYVMTQTFFMEFVAVVEDVLNLFLFTPGQEGFHCVSRPCCSCVPT